MLSAYSGFTLSDLVNYNSFRYSSTANKNTIFGNFKLDATVFSKYVFYALATDRVNFHINKVLTTYPNGLYGASSITGSFDVYSNYVVWKQSATFVDNYVLDLMSATGSLSSLAYTNLEATQTTSIPLVIRDRYNNLLSVSTASSVTGFQYSASSYDGLI